MNETTKTQDELAEGASLTGAALLAVLDENNRERTRRDWFVLGVKFCLWETMPDATDEERDAVIAKVVAEHDRIKSLHAKGGAR